MEVGTVGLFNVAYASKGKQRNVSNTICTLYPKRVPPGY